MSKKIALLTTTLTLNISLLLMICTSVYADVIVDSDHSRVVHNPVFFIYAAVLVLIVVIVGIIILLHIRNK